MKTIEIWRTAIVDGETYENYQVSNLGRLMSLNYNRTGKAELLKPFDNGRGYLQVALCKNKIPQDFLLHRIIAETFLPNPEGKPCVNHKIEGNEGKKINMVIFNEDGTIDEERTTIEWATYEENNNYETRTERAAKTRSKKVLQLSLTGDLISEWPSTKECGRNGFNSGNVVECCNGKRKTHKGFLWIYAEDYK